MKFLADKILTHKRLVLGIFIISAVICAVLKQQVRVNYNLADYLPDEARSTISIDFMENAYESNTPNVRVYIPEVSLTEALDYKSRLSKIEGVIEITWLDDSADLTQPLEILDQELVESYYKDQGALYSLTIDEANGEQILNEIKEVVGSQVAMTGEAVTDAAAQASTASELNQIMGFVIPLIFVILLVSTSSWFEPVLFLITIGVSILLNSGTNVVFGEISFVTNSTSSILQLAVSMDYAIFLLHRFSEYRQEGMEIQAAMKSAMIKSASAIFSSGMTTFFGFAALCLMSFKIGVDMGVVLAKGIVFSLVSVMFFLPVLAIYTYRWIDKTHYRSLMPSFRGLGKLATVIRKPMLFVVLLLVLPSFLAQNQTNFIYGGSGMSAPDSKEEEDKQLINSIFGEENTMALMVPQGLWEQEKELSEAIDAIPEVRSVTSYVGLVGSEIPVDYIPKEQASLLISNGYSRMIIHAEVEEEGEAAFEVVSQIRDLANQFYGEDYYFAGETVSTFDIKQTVTADNVWVNFMAIVAIGIVLVLTFKSASIPIILLLTIETSIWINLGIPYFQGISLNYIGYLVINSVQLGATVDYAILFAESYLNHRKNEPKTLAMQLTIMETAPSILTSGSILCLAGVMIGAISSNVVISQLGVLIGRGAAISVALVLFFLPTLLGIFDEVIEKTTYDLKFYKEKRNGGDSNESIAI